jgi:hypothetical protein
MEAWVPGFVTGSLALLGVLAAGWFQSRRERSQQRHSSFSPGAPTVQQIWERQDKMERAFKSCLALLGEVAEQEQVDPTQLSKRHLRILAEGNYLPPEWEHLVERTQ